MSVVLGTLNPADDDEFESVDVSTSDYDAGWIRLQQSDPELPDDDTIVIDRRQMQHLSLIIDTFLS